MQQPETATLRKECQPANLVPTNHRYLAGLEKAEAGPWYKFAFTLFRILIDLAENQDLTAEPGGTAN